MEMIDLWAHKSTRCPTEHWSVQGERGERCIECIDDLALNDLPMKRRISLAVLAAFSNHRWHDSLDRLATVQTFRPVASCCFREEDGERKGVEKAEARVQRELEEEENKKAKKYKKKKDKRLKREERKRADEMDTHPVSSIGAKRPEGNQTDDETSQQEVAEEEKMERQNDDCGDDGEEEIAREKMDRHNEGGNDGENESAGNTRRTPPSRCVGKSHQQLDIKPDEDIWEKIGPPAPRLISSGPPAGWNHRCPRAVSCAGAPQTRCWRTLDCRRWTHG